MLRRSSATPVRCALLALAMAGCAKEQLAPSAVIPPPNLAAVSSTQPKPAQEYDYTPRISQPPPPPEVVPDKQGIVDQFRTLYAKQNKPKLLVYINRDLVEGEPKPKAAHEKTVGEHRIYIREDVFLDPYYRPYEYPHERPIDPKPKPPAPTEKDREKEKINKQIMWREIEDAFGFPFRQGGGLFVDQKIATLMNSSLLHEKAEAGSPQARDAEAVRKSADIVVQLLLDQRAFPVHDIGGDHDVTLPVMTATAIRLSDSQIVAQVTSMGLFGLDSHDPKNNLTAVMVKMTPSEIAQNMAFALMRDLNHAWGGETK